VPGLPGDLSTAADRTPISKEAIEKLEADTAKAKKLADVAKRRPRALR
jgi:hypothetical protein